VERLYCLTRSRRLIAISAKAEIHFWNDRKSSANRERF
jgi:hypothetical protein